MAEPILLGAVYRWQLDNGQVVELELKPDLADAIRRMDEALRQRERRRAKREVTFTDARIDADAVQTRALLAAPGGSAWEGPYYQFSTLLGASRVWNGPSNGHGCPVCHGAHLESTEYCLWCDRSGADSIIPRPGVEAVKACHRAEAERRGERATGGRGKATPPKPARAKRKRRS